jgi:hypothetical protein
MNKARVSKSGGKHGAVLVITLLLIVVLAVATVAFMQNTSTDRQTARSIGSHYRAQLAAEAGAAAAEALVADLVRRYPDSATVWQNIGGGTGGAAGTNNEATVLYVRAQSANTNLGARPAQFGGEVSLLAWPLLSRTNATNSTLLSSNAVPLASVSSNLPFATNDPNVVNLNATNSSRPRPFVGRRSATNAGAPVTAAQWVYLGAQPGPTNANNPAIARYAFWIEDESFKVNVNVATNGLRGTESLGLSPAEMRLDGAWGSSANAALRGADAGTVVTARNGLPDSNFPTALTAAIPANLTDEQAADELKFLTTTFSAGLDLSRGGFKRFNINTVTNGIAGPTDTGNIRTNLNRVIAAITNSNSVPNFGQRFYRLATNAATGTNPANINALAVTSQHANIYLQKMAANIMDYVDADDQPTVISNNTPSFTLISGRPANAVGNEGTEGPNPLAAMGVENLPYLYGYAIHARLAEMDPPGYNTNNPPPILEASFNFTVDHYLEMWNPGSRDVVVGSGTDTNEAYIGEAFLKIANAPGWGTQGATTGALNPDFAPGNRDFTVRLTNGSRFPAGASVLLTTARPEAARLVASNAVNIVSTEEVPSELRTFVGKTTFRPTPTPNNSYEFDRLFAVRIVQRDGTALDAQTEVLLGNNEGILSSFAAGTLATMVIRATNASSFNSDQLFVNRSSLRGNRTDTGALVGTVGNPRSTEGDVRALNEQIELKPFLASTGGTIHPDQTRFFAVTSAASLGQPNTAFVNAGAWVDFSSLSAGSNNAPLIVKNRAMETIGEIGHLTDPARVPGLAGDLTNVIYSRGGGRTLRIGQSEHPWWYDRNQTNASRTWTSWRLADIFTTTWGSNITTSTNAQGILTNALGVVRGPTNANGAVLTIPGLINPNGFLRDRGAAWRATLHGLNYLPAPEGVGLPALNDSRINAMINAMAARMTNAAAAGLPAGSLNAFWERGEISELPIFNTGNIPTTMSNQFDRGREELVRRSIEMITTRGSVFTVYAIGQTLQGTNVTGTARMKQTFQIEPVFQDPADAFNDAFPIDGGGIQRRFAPPTNYTLRVLATSYD